MRTMITKKKVEGAGGSCELARRCVLPGKEMPSMPGRQLVRGVVALLAALGAASAATAGNYDTGATDTSIKLGQTMPYSGPASAYSAIGRAEIAYFKMLNDKGGINGRKVELLSMDDGYSPSKTVEQVGTPVFP